MHLIVTRPEADSAELKTRVEQSGHRVSLAPLLSVSFTGAPLDFSGVQALIVTSRNGLRALAAGPHLQAALGLPLFAVGETSATLARELGFRRVTAGMGGARELLGHIVEGSRPESGILLNLTGDAVAFDVGAPLEEHGFKVTRQVVYRAVEATALPQEVADAIRAGAADGVILMSARTARTFTKLTDQHAIHESARRLSFICLSQAVADGLGGLKPARVSVAREPCLEEILALVEQMASNP